MCACVCVCLLTSCTSYSATMHGCDNFASMTASRRKCCSMYSSFIFSRSTILIATCDVREKVGGVEIESERKSIPIEMRNKWSATTKPNHVHSTFSSSSTRQHVRLCCTCVHFPISLIGWQRFRPAGAIRKTSDSANNRAALPFPFHPFPRNALPTKHGAIELVDV